MATIHISEAEAARDFAAVMKHVREGADVIIENGPTAVAVLSASDVVPPRRRLSESLRLIQERGSHAVPDGDFARDVEDGISRNSAPSANLWE